MSRIGKKPILIPEGVEVKINGKEVSVKGPKGEIVKTFLPDINIELKDKEILVYPDKGKEEIKKIKAFWGLTRSLLNNMVLGVVNGFEKQLKIEGVGYKSEVVGEELVLSVGFSHQVKLAIPKGLEVTADKNVITVKGIDKELVGQFASVTKKVKPVEPYKGKGIRYVGEVVRRKAGKKVAAAGS